jgi:hypothetical protein
MSEAVQAAAVRADVTALRGMLQRPDATAETVGPAVVAAATAGDAGTVGMLLDACPAARTEGVLNAALGRACSYGYADVARELLRRGAAAKARDGMGFPLIVRAASRGYSGVVHALLDAGADPNAPVVEAAGDAIIWSPPDAVGLTPLLAASARGNPATVRLLLARGASVRRRMQDGLTALRLCREGRTYSIRKRAVGIGIAGAADVPERAIRMRQQVARETNCLEVQELLRQAGCAE